MWDLTSVTSMTWSPNPQGEIMGRQRNGDLHIHHSPTKSIHLPTTIGCGLHAEPASGVPSGPFGVWIVSL